MTSLNTISTFREGDVVDTSYALNDEERGTHWIVDGFIGETSRIRQWRRENFDDGDDEADVSDTTAVLSTDSQMLALSLELQEKYKCIGRRLAVMTDDYFQRVRPQIYEAVDLCDISVDTNGREAYNRFIAVANGLFEQTVSMEKIQMLLLFGYELLKKLLKNRLPKMVCVVVSFLARFMNEEKVCTDQAAQSTQTITQWVVREGGWIAAASAVKAAKKSTLPWDVIVLGTMFAGYAWMRFRN